MSLSLSPEGEARLFNVVCLLIGIIMFYRGITDFLLFEDNPYRTLLGLIFFGGVVSIWLMYQRRRIGFWMFCFFDFSVGIVFIFFLQDIWYHHVLPHVAYAALFVPFYGQMRWGRPPDPLDRRVPPEPKSNWTGWITDHLVSFVDRWPIVARTIERIRPLQRLVNRLVINGVTSAPPPRPLPFSLWTPDSGPVARVEDGSSTRGTFTSWPGLIDRAFTGRHLPPITEGEVAALPPVDEVVALFLRGSDFKPSGKTTALFCFFAQWFTDSFLRTNPEDARKNTSNHEIDLCQIYGLGEESTRMLREGTGGLLKSREGKRLPWEKLSPVYPPFLVDPEKLEVKPEFARIAFDPIMATSFDEKDPPHGMARDLRALLEKIGEWTQTDERWVWHYAAGLERANSTIMYSAINTVFLREHNRLARELGSEYPERAAASDGDDWLFQTARNINVVLLLKIIIEDYINHLAGSPFKLKLEQGFADRCRWYRTNRITLEFNLLYRWHAMVPDVFHLGGRELKDQEFRFNNELLEQHGAEAVIHAASTQKAGRLVLSNTPSFLKHPELRSIAFARQFRLAGFNAYRRRWQLPSYKSIAELTGGNSALTQALERLYPDLNGIRGVERVELPVGLLAEARSANQVLPPLLQRMVASDAFSQALTNPLLASFVYGVNCFTEYGVGEIERTGSFADVVHRNQTLGTEPVSADFSNPAFTGDTPA
ncbi:peroxidase family protein [Mesorhizobium sp. L48C026A00]|uniref:peroxidase family protein n=1 Tax=Mesorhizobium sp. L48C026A00 TaxID=1287182 RepID=UPI0018DDD5AC|nr:peroxidase family protein [Mesorhizobium sp. L48C026A00]